MLILMGTAGNRHETPIPACGHQATCFLDVFLL
jgi:hypothetical protein